ncbi:metallophosphoesterase [Pollutimonas sp. H1-120]|uniref:metallophosphoesterase family protein n=1 Tax=Pollutimonas sp. H1-120 TaxID=3148824 RepID=UPI003B51A452
MKTGNAYLTLYQNIHRRGQEKRQDSMQSPLFRFAVIADSHIEPEPNGTSTRNNLRNAAVVRMLNAHQPEFVIHCGDILHVPAFGPHFHDAAGISKSIYNALEMPIYSTPGNQDIGDKPSAWMPAPAATPEYTKMYEQHYGPAWQSVVHQGCHFVFINSPILNSGHTIEQEQRVWLDSYLEKAKGERIFLITHYPIFLLDEHEPSHYDNIDEPARGWLLERIDRYGIEAVFAGHVHNFFYTRRKNSDYYILPSTAFVRRDYSELFNIEPGQDAEFGRNEPGKLGFLLVDVLAKGCRPHYVRSYGLTEVADTLPADSLPSSVFCQNGIGLGVTLRHRWFGITTLSANNTTDEFIRKQVRSDYVLEGIWHLGIKTIRVFMDDLYAEDSRQRLALLSSLGYEVHIQSAGLPTNQDIQLITSNASDIHCWEIVLPVEQHSMLLSLLPRLPYRHVRVALAKFENSAQYRHEQINYPHFLAAGFNPGLDNQWIAELIAKTADAPEILNSLVYRTSWSEDPSAFAQATRKQLKDSSLQTIMTASWAPSEPGEFQADDAAITSYVLKLSAAATVPGCKVMLDIFSDLDRGYYPRHGVMDRRYDPRPAGQLMRNVHQLFDRLGEAPVFVSSHTDEHDGWQAQLRAGSKDVILSISGSQGHDVASWLANMDAPNDQLTVIDLQTGQEKTLIWPSGKDAPGAIRNQLKPWQKYLACLS